MGVVKNKAIKFKFISYTIQAITYSMLATFISLFFILCMINTGIIKSADYYDKMIPNIREYIYLNQNEILNPEFKNELNKIIPSKGITYEVRYKNDDLIYENNDYINFEKVLKDVKGRNTEQKIIEGSLKGNIFRYFPIIKNKELIGYINIGYSMVSSSEIQLLNNIASNINFVIILLPFIYLVIFIITFSNKFIKYINQPIEILKESITKIENNDLDFEINYNEENELGYLCKSFENMRCTLKYTLEDNWKKDGEKKDIISAISHDLRTPITVINGYTEMLMINDDIDINNARTSISAIKRNTDTINKLIEDINRINKLNEMDFKIYNKHIELDKFIVEKKNDYEVLCSFKNIKINLNVNLNNNCILIDDNALTQILDNLINNSIRFTDEYGHIDIYINKTNNKFTIIVEDCGTGFSKNDLNHAFELFYKGDKSRKKSGNHGIGLYVVHELVRKMNGNIDLYNTDYGAGTKIEFKV